MESLKLEFVLVVSVGVSCLAFLLSAYLHSWVKKQPSQNKEISRISEYIRQGANSFLRKEYQVLAKFCGAVAILIFLFLPGPFWKGGIVENITMTAAFIFGTVFSAIAGKIGIHVTTLANSRTAEAAQNGIEPAFLNGFRGGAVMGMAVVGTSLLGVTLIFWLTDSSTMLLGFSLGASTLALFAKAGGGIFTKTADIAADLVGKVEMDIPEDDPRNPAVIADNVGDNVGDVAGMGADLFDSNVASMAAALVMAVSLDAVTGKQMNTSMVFCYAVAGLLASIIGIATARMGKSGPTSALNRGTYITTAIFAALTAGATLAFDFDWRFWGAGFIGLMVGVIIGIATDYFTDDSKKPVHMVAKASRLGPPFTILSGISYGFLSVLPAMAGIGISALASYLLCAPLGDGY